MADKKTYQHRTGLGDRLSDIVNDVVAKAKSLGANIRFAYERASITARPDQERNDVMAAALESSLPNVVNQAKLLGWVQNYVKLNENYYHSYKLAKFVLETLESNGYKSLDCAGLETSAYDDPSIRGRFAIGQLVRSLRDYGYVTSPDLLLADIDKAIKGRGDPSSVDPTRLAAFESVRRDMLMEMLPGELRKPDDLVKWIKNFAILADHPRAPIDYPAIVSAFEAAGYDAKDAAPSQAFDGSKSDFSQDSQTPLRMIAGQIIESAKRGEAPSIDSIDGNYHRYFRATANQRFQVGLAASHQYEVRMQAALVAKPDKFDDQRMTMQWIGKFAQFGESGILIPASDMKGVVEALESKGYSTNSQVGLPPDDYKNADVMAEFVVGQFLKAVKEGTPLHSTIFERDIARYEQELESAPSAPAFR